MSDTRPPVESQPTGPTPPNYPETFNAENVVVMIFEGEGDNTIRPVRPSLRPYLNWHPRPERPPTDG